MVKAYRAWPSVQQMDRPGAWLRRVTINASMSWHRGHRRESAAVALEQVPPAADVTVVGLSAGQLLGTLTDDC